MFSIHADGYVSELFVSSISKSCIVILYPVLCIIITDTNKPIVFSNIVVSPHDRHSIN